MAYIIETYNAFEPLKAVKHVLHNRMTVMGWVRMKYPNLGEFPVPTICLVNGDPLLRKDWGREIEPNDIVNFIAVPAGIETIIIIILVVAVVAFTLVTTLNAPKVPGEQPASDPVFTTKGQANAIRLGEPIECNYGRNRIYPSYASRPYFEYANNDQFQFSLFCLGQGEYEIDAIQIGDTPIASFQEVQWEVIPPGFPVTLFPSAVYSAPEAGGQILYGPNEPEYVAPGWTGPFPTNPPGTQTTKLQIDVNLPKGLYRMQKSGKPDVRFINFTLAVRPIDDLGTPTGPYVDTTYTITATTTTPQRRTFVQDVLPGRYEARMRRTNIAGLGSSYGDQIVWEALRSYLDVTQDFGNVTLLAVKIRATNNLNSNTQQQFNIICTRKLPIRESGGVFSDPMPTRSIVWAIVDIFRSLYGGRILEDTFFDWDALEELDALYEERGEYFDWSFRDPITVWEAARAVARVGRATPLLAGSLITVKRDGPLEIPVALFNPDNIIEGSFEWNIKLWDLDEFDSISAEYTDPTTGYKQEQVLCVLPGGTTDHPQSVTFAGIQDRAHAYHEGLYMLASQLYLRENITLDTGLEGFIPTFGDLITVVHDVPKWGQGGYVVNAERGAGDEYHLWLSEPLNFEESNEYQMALRGRRGEVIGPFTVTEVEELQQCIIHSAEDIDFLLGGKNEPMLFQFGIANQITKYLRVVKIEPQGGEAIRITAVTEAPIIHSFDSLTPPPLNTPALPPVAPALPEVGPLTVTQVDAALHIVQVSWASAFGAQYYLIQTSEDGTHWRDRPSTTRASIQVQVFPGDLYVRVAAVNAGQGPWSSNYLSVGFILELKVEHPWKSTLWEVSWQLVLQATGYLVQVYDNTVPLTPVLKHTETVTTLNFTYTYDIADLDGNLVREMLVKVRPVFEDLTTEAPVSLALHNSIPGKAFDLDAVIDSVESDAVYYMLVWSLLEEHDMIRTKLWLSPTNGFDPAVEIPVLDEILSSPGSGMPTEYLAAVFLDSAGDHPAMYWRVALYDVWGDEISTNITAQQTIPAYT